MTPMPTIPLAGPRELTANERRIADLFRRLGKFREDCDAAILDEIALGLRLRMSEAQADQVMSDAVLVDNELRFRLAGGIDLNKPGDQFATADEDALVTLIGAATHDFVAVVAAERLGIDNHRVLRQAAALLLRSLERGGFGVGWSDPRNRLWRGVTCRGTCPRGLRAASRRKACRPPRIDAAHRPLLLLGAAALVAAQAIFATQVIAAEAGPQAGPSDAIFVAQVVALVLVGRALGEVMQRLGQPAIIGQLLAGIVLGASVLGALGRRRSTCPRGRRPESHDRRRRPARRAHASPAHRHGDRPRLGVQDQAGRSLVSLTGIAVPFACGFLAGELLLPDSLLPTPERRLVTSLFLGTALSISSVKIVAMVVREMNFMRRDLGQVIIASAIIDDTLGWIIVAITFSLGRAARSKPLSLAKSIGGTLLFLGASLTVGRPVVHWLIRWTNDRLVSEVPVITVILVIMGVMALITDAIGVHTVLGAFVAGILIGKSPILTQHIEAELRGLITALFMPVFFALAGLSTDLSILKNPHLLLVALGLILIATVGKFGGAFLGGTLGDCRGGNRWRSASP